MPQQTTESLEQRTLLTTVGILTGPTDLTIFVDDGDSATVQRNQTTGNVEVLDANGQAYTSIPTIQASLLTSLNIFADDADNTLSVAPVTSSEFSALSTIVIDAGDGDDVITGSDDFADSIDGGDGNDIITGGGGDDTLDAGDGNDLVTGGAGLDSILGGNGQDTINGGSGNDNIDAGDGQDLINGGTGDDTINAGDGLDTVNGGAGADSINGMSGADLLNGDADNDTILGGSENDIVNGGDGNDIVNGQAGNDTVNGDAGDDTGYGGGGRDALFGGDGDDIINGQSGNDSLIGNDGNDSAYGGSGDDSLFGDDVTPTSSSVGNDVLKGQAGNDTLDGGGGNDLLDGGAGNDLLQPNLVDLSAAALSLSIDDTMVTEGDVGLANVSVTVHLSHASIEPVTVDYSTVDDTAVSGIDYQTVSGTLVFAAGQTTRTITVPVRGDVIDEIDETFFVNLSNAFGAILSDTQATVTIIDNDVSGGLPQLSIDDVVVNPELNGPSSFTFAPLVSYSAIAPTNSIALGDFDGDLDIDIVTAGFNSSTGLTSVTLFLNDGTGSFVPGGSFSVPSLALAFDITAGDFDQDGDLDCAVAGSTGNIGSAIRVAILRNDGLIGGVPIFSVSQTVSWSGTFQSPIGMALVSSDLDGVPGLDIAVGHTRLTGANPGGISILQNNGSGVFTYTTEIPLSGPTGAVATGDLNQDGNVDLVATSSPGATPDETFVLLGNGNGTFATPTVYTTLSSRNNTLRGIELADIDGDGDLDVIAAADGTSAGSGSVVALTNNGSGVLSAPATVFSDNTHGVENIATGDFDLDGNVDIALIGDTSVVTTGRVRVLIGNGAGVFTPTPTFQIGAAAVGGIKSADFNGDGLLDVAVLQGPGLGIFLNRRDPPVFASGFVRISSPSALPVTVTISTADGLAQLGSDYQQPVATTLTIPAGATSTSFTIPILSDISDEPNENFFVNLSAPVNVTIADSQGQVTIVDDDGGVIAAPTLTISDVTMAEGNAGTTNFVFTVTLTRPAGNNSVVTIDYVTADDSATSGGPQPDYTAATPTTLTFAAGVTQQQIIIPVNGDAFVESDEAFFVHLLNPSVGTLLTRSRAIGLIQDDDGGPPTPLVLVNDVLIDEANGAAVVTLTLSSPALSPVSINLSTVDGSARAGSDYSAVTTTIIIPVGATSGMSSVPIIADTRDERAEFFTVNLLSATNALLTATSLQVTINDDDGTVFSSPNDCVLIGGSGNDTINGGLGNDTVDGSVGNDSINGGSGDDSIQGGDGNDTIDGGSGDDTIAGQGGNDVVSTGSGIDTVLWDGLGNGTDTILESDGAQTLIVQGDSGANSFNVDSNQGLLRVSEGAASITASRTTTTVNVFGGSGNDLITISSIADVRPVVLDIDGQGDNDTISASDANIGDVRMFLNGGTGNDTITGSRDNDSINGNGGDDSVIGGLGDDSVDGGDGNDTLNGDAGNDFLVGNTGNDLMDGGVGNDLVTGGLGNDTAIGGEGDDTLLGGFGDDVLNGNSGNDLADGGRDNDQVLGGSGDDSLDGGTGDDTIRGQSGDDLIKGGDGNDNIRGEGGNDIIDAGDGDDDVDAGDGNDIATGGDGNDTLNGMSGADTLLGGNGNDNQLGGAGIDSLYGEEGDDSLNGGSSTDQFNGGEGVDVLVDPDAGEVDNNSLAIEVSVMQALALLNGF